jgi:hypothetical protein
MDRLLTEAAYQSPDIPSAETTKVWSTDDTVLTITPNADLMYTSGEVDDLTFAAMSYLIKMTDTAEDQAGNRLVPKDWSFATLRRISQVLHAKEGDIRQLRNGGNLASGKSLNLGDDDQNQALGGFVQFHLSDLVPGVVEYGSAFLWGERSGPLGEGDPRTLDPIRVREFSENILLAGPSTVFGPDLGVFIEAFVTYPSLSVLPAMTSTYADDGLIQFRLRGEPDESNDNDENDYFAIVNGLALSLEYLAP